MGYPPDRPKSQGSGTATKPPPSNFSRLDPSRPEGHHAMSDRAASTWNQSIPDSGVAHGAWVFSDKSRVCLEDDGRPGNWPRLVGQDVAPSSELTRREKRGWGVLMGRCASLAEGIQDQEYSCAVQGAQDAEVALPLLEGGSDVVGGCQLVRDAVEGPGHCG